MKNYIQQLLDKEHLGSLLIKHLIDVLILVTH